MLCWWYKLRQFVFLSWSRAVFRNIMMIFVALRLPRYPLTTSNFQITLTVPTSVLQLLLPLFQSGKNELILSSFNQYLNCLFPLNLFYCFHQFRLITQIVFSRVGGEGTTSLSKIKWNIWILFFAGLESYHLRILWYFLLFVQSSFRWPSLEHDFF